MGKRVGIFAFDPGVTTGVASGVFEIKSTVAKTLTDGAVKGSKILEEVKLPENQEGLSYGLHAADVLEGLYATIRYTWGTAYGVEPGDMHLVSEDFILNSKATQKRSSIVPVRISSSLEGMVLKKFGDFMHYQTPAQAKSFATNERLKLWGIYVKGSEHKRDALRHVALRIDKLLK